MKRLLVVLLLSLGGVAYAGKRLDLEREPAHGAPLWVVDGVAIYHHRPGHDKRGPFGLQFECVEFVNRWLVHQGHRNLTRTGHAISYYEKAESKGLIAYPNGGAEPPRWGDVIVFSSSAQPYGHVGVVTGVSDDRIWVASQNATLRLPLVPFVKTLTHDVPFRLSRSGDGWIVHGKALSPLSVLGWSRPKQK